MYFTRFLTVAAVAGLASAYSCAICPPTTQGGGVTYTNVQHSSSIGSPTYCGCVFSDPLLLAHCTSDTIHSYNSDPNNHSVATFYCFYSVCQVADLVRLLGADTLLAVGREPRRF
jgi:hypothetical protein